MATEYNQSELTDFFIYLDGLRESGVTNMFGAGQWLQDEFDMSRQDASNVLSLWMKTFHGDKSCSDRAKEALATK